MTADQISVQFAALQASSQALSAKAAVPSVAPSVYAGMLKAWIWNAA